MSTPTFGNAAVAILGSSACDHDQVPLVWCYLKAVCVMNEAVALRCLDWQMKKARYRAKHRSLMAPRIERVIYSMVRMGSPWQCIQSTAAILRDRKKERTDWCGLLDVVEIQRIAKDVHNRMTPLQRREVEDPSNELHVTAKSHCMRWTTAQWVVQQNMKGVAIPSELVVAKYVEAWGPRPHVVGVSRHIDQLSKVHFRKKWLRTLRRDWSFKYGALPLRGMVGDAEIGRKVAGMLVRSTTPSWGELEPASW